MRWLRERLAAADGTPTPPAPGDTFDEELGKMEADGALQAIRDRYMPPLQLAPENSEDQQQD